MIPQTDTTGQTPLWQIALTEAVTDPAELLSLLDLDPALLSDVKAGADTFALRVPRQFVSRINKGDPLDPLLQQILPLSKEKLSPPGFEQDPLGEKQANPVPGLLHKYKNRVLLTLPSNCAVHCRYCFRRHFPYAQNNPGTQGWPAIIDYISAHPDINEVIFSGGDPLLAPDKLLADLAMQLAKIPHLKTLRIHSRIPIVLPERITEEFLSWFTATGMQPVLVIHCNHAQEIDAAVKKALVTLVERGITVLNQSVLLKGVNDDAATLIALCNTLFACRVMPYYLHLLDKVQGAAHFDVSQAKGQQLMWELMQQLPGYLVPKLVKEQAGAPCKIPVSLSAD